MRHTYECHVRWSDVDAYSQVDNIAYLESCRADRFLSDLVDWRTSVLSWDSSTRVARSGKHESRPVNISAG